MDKTFDPTKVGYNSISINGDFGRTPRIEVDGLDVSDETVGTTTQNIALSSIQEFSIGRSSLDISTEITSTGSVNLATRSGTNSTTARPSINSATTRIGFADLPGRRVFAISAQPIWRPLRRRSHQEQAFFLYRFRTAQAG
jgi:hypothetical protein